MLPRRCLAAISASWRGHGTMTEKTLDRIAVTGGDYAVARWQSPGSQPLLLVHGITASHMHWPRVVDKLSGRFDIYAPDLRGRGRSHALPGPFGLQAHVHDLLAVLDAFHIERVLCAGHSLGAYIAIELAAHAPDRIAGLVLVDGGIVLPLPEGQTAESAVSALLGPAIQRLHMIFASRGAYREFWRAHPAFQDEEAWTEYMAACADYDLVETESGFRSVVNPEAVRQDAYGPLDPAMQTRLEGLRCPVLLLTASRGLLNQPGSMLPVPRVQDALARNANLRHVEVTDTNHYTIALGSGAARVAGYIEEFSAAVG